MSQVLERTEAQPSHASHSPAPTTPAPASGFPMRAWQSLAGIVLLAGLGGWAMYDRFLSGADERTDLVELSRGPGLMMNFGAPAIRPDGIRETGTDRYQVKAGDALLNVAKSKDGSRTYQFTYDKPDLVPPADRPAFTARLRLMTDPAYAKSLGVTADQVQKLRDLAVPPRGRMTVNADDQKQLAQLFDTYVSAPPPRAAESEAVIGNLREIGERSLEPTRKALADAAAQIRGILTAKQLEPFQPKPAGGQ